MKENCLQTPSLESNIPITPSLNHEFSDLKNPTHSDLSFNVIRPGQLRNQTIET